MSFHDAQFPTDVSYGSRGGPGYNTTIIQLDSGQETRIGRWNNAKRQYDVSYGIKSFSDLDAVLKFYIARQGALFSFRYKDWLDYNTSSTSNSTGTTTFTDQNIGTADGTTTTFQLIKTYTDNSISRIRTITKPITSTVTIGVGGVEQTSGFTVNGDDGTVVFSPAPSSGAITWGGEFDVETRFSKATDTLLSMSIDDFESGSVDSILLEEVISEVSIGDEFYYGGSTYLAMASDTFASLSTARVYNVFAQSTGLDLMLPDPTTILSGFGGGPVFYINSNSPSFNITDHNNNLIQATALNTLYTCLIGTNAGSNKYWIVVA